MELAVNMVFTHACTQKVEMSFSLLWGKNIYIPEMLTLSWT